MKREKNFREGSQFVEWNYNSDGFNKPLTWYQTTFKTPALEGKVIVLYVNGLNRGHIYLNGYDVAHYWTIIGTCEDAHLFCKFKLLKKKLKLLYFSRHKVC